MSSPERKNRRFVLILAALLPVLAGCSFSPLYEGKDGLSASDPGFAYAEPTNRYEQIIYQELAFRLGTDPNPTAPLVSISASSAAIRMGRTSPGSVMTTNEAIVTAKLTVDSRDPEANHSNHLLSLTRSASSTYEISGQVSADRFALDTASENAARSVAETFRLILAAARRNGEI